MNRTEKAEAVLQIIEQFVKDQRIYCAETIWQCDWVIENAYEFIDDLVSIAGFLPEEEDE